MINKKKNKRTVTFFYLREEEKQIFLNLAPELKKENFNIKFSKKLSGKADIGFYCQTDIKKINSNVSAIFLGGMDQGRVDWPNMWKKQPWNKFDLGFLPGKNWKKMWINSSTNFEARTRKGVFEVGWPKADHLYSNNFKHKKYRISKKKINVLYAPSFECFGRQLEVTRAVKKCNFNLIIKHWLHKKEKRFADLWNEIQLANIATLKLYKKKTLIVNPKDNFLGLLNYVDLIITDESSVAYEGLLNNIPTISVKDWKIQRHKKTTARYVNPAKITLSSTKANLVKSINKAINLKKNKLIKLRKENFSYLGKSSEIIVLILKKFIENPVSLEKLKYYIKPKKQINILTKLKKFIY